MYFLALDILWPVTLVCEAVIREAGVARPPVCAALGALVVHCAVGGGAEMALERRALEHLGPGTRGAPSGQIPVIPGNGHQIVQGGGRLVVLSRR